MEDLNNRPHLTDDELKSLDKESLIEKFKLLEKYVQDLEVKLDVYKTESDKKFKELDETKSLEILKLKNLLLLKYMREQEVAVSLEFQVLSKNTCCSSKSFCLNYI